MPSKIVTLWTVIQDWQLDGAGPARLECSEFFEGPKAFTKIGEGHTRTSKLEDGTPAQSMWARTPEQAIENAIATKRRAIAEHEERVARQERSLAAVEALKASRR